MRLLNSPSETVRNTAVALGNFDGVHLGHTALLERCVSDARENGLKSLVWTFRAHPDAVLHKASPRLILSLEDKITLLDKIGLSFFMAEDFSRVCDYSPERFCNEILLERLGAREVLCGFNFSFGKGGAGNAAFLKEYLEKRGVKVLVLPAVGLDGETVSSTAVRALLEEGDMEKAARFLGRNYFIHLPVEHGKRLGTKLGFPTVNQNFPAEYVVPLRGVYAVKVHTNCGDFNGVCNIGSRPTVDDGEEINAETHLLDFSGNLYGQKLKIDFYHLIRREKKFENLDALKQQIEKDKRAAAEYFLHQY